MSDAVDVLKDVNNKAAIKELERKREVLKQYVDKHTILAAIQYVDWQIEKIKKGQ